MNQVRNPRSLRETADVPWNTLPHPWIYAEIDQAVAADSVTLTSCFRSRPAAMPRIRLA